MSKIGNGTLILVGNNTYTGTATISAGVVQVGNGATAGTLGNGTVTDNAALVFLDNNNDVPTVSNKISGNGTVTQAGSDTTDPGRCAQRQH